MGDKVWGGGVWRGSRRGNHCCGYTFGSYVGVGVTSQEGINWNVSGWADLEVVGGSSREVFIAPVGCLNSCYTTGGGDVAVRNIRRYKPTPDHTKYSMAASGEQ